MPLHLVSPFDRDPEPPGEAEARPARKRRALADLCFLLIQAGAFLGSIYLAVLGLPLALFLLLVGGNPTLLFTQLENLSAHYLAADHMAQTRFIQMIAYSLLGLATFIVIWRLPRFASQVAQTLADRRKEL